jgi:hypothetical protein
MKMSKPGVKKFRMSTAFPHQRSEGTRGNRYTVRKADAHMLSTARYAVSDGHGNNVWQGKYKSNARDVKALLDWLQERERSAE